MATLSDNAAELRAGLQAAARELGEASVLYRPASPLTHALDPANGRGGLLAAFARNYAYSVASDPLKPQRVAILDPALVAVGDYVTGPGGKVHFIASMEPLLPIAAVYCNATISIYRQSDTSATVGAVGRLGNVSVGSNVSEIIALDTFPASVIYSGRGAKTLSNLPTDDTAPQLTVLLPPLPFVVEVGDIVTDNLARRMTVRAFERNAGGVRLIVMQAVQ